LAWRIEFDEAAVRQFRKMPVRETTRIRDYLRDRIATLADPRQTGKSLNGARFGALWPYRVGEYRILCELHDDRLVVLVVEIGHRREVYR
jgi:mRNA interferase RelE/StbE